MEDPYPMYVAVTFRRRRRIRRCVDASLGRIIPSSESLAEFSSRARHFAYRFTWQFPTLLQQRAACQPLMFRPMLQEQQNLPKKPVSKMQRPISSHSTAPANTSRILNFLFQRAVLIV